MQKEWGEMKKTYKQLLVSLYLLIPLGGYTEGTKEIQPNTTHLYYLLFNRANSGSGLNIPFGLYTPNSVTYPPGTKPEDYRFNIHICRPGERVRLGFRTNASNVWYRVKDPNGNIVFGPVNIPTTNGSLGYINTYAEAVAGPRSRVGPAGYRDTGFVATMAGDYYIEFNRGHASIYQPTQILITLFDISVYGVDNLYKPGRIWSKAWQLADANNPFSGSFYIYSDDGIVTRLIGNGIEPHYFSVSCNSTGCTNTGNPVEDRKSRNDRWLYPQYKIFLNNPDEACFPTGSFGNIIGTPSIEGCGSNNCIYVNVDKPGTIIVTLDLNGIPGFQQNSADRQIQITAVQGLNCVPWDGKNGLGVPVQNGTSVPLQVDFLNGITHLPLYDVENNRNGIIVDLIRPTGPRPKIFWDDSRITAGTALDGLVNLTGCTNPSGCHRFTGRGDNACPPCSETINSWWYAKVDTARATFVHHSVDVDANRLKPGRGDANNSNECGNLLPIQLNGFFSGSQGIQWSTSGTGVFSNINDINATYIPSAQDVVNGSVKLTIKSIGNGLCPPDSDYIVMTLIKPPFANAGGDTAVCVNNRSIKLNGTFGNASSASWVGGSGSFTPNRNTPDATYTASNVEISSGNPIVLTLRTSTNGPCPAAESQVRIAIRPTPIVNAGNDQTVCVNNPVVSLNGSSSTGAGVWSFSGSSANFSNPNSLSTTYSPTPENLAANSYVLTLTSTNNGACLPVSSNITITNNKNVPTIDLGSDRILCLTSESITLNSSITNATGRIWRGNGGMFTPGGNTSTSEAVTYTLSDAEKNSSKTFVMAETEQANNCLPAKDTVWITIVPKPTANAGADRSVCVNSTNPISLSGSITGATGGMWSSLGGGTFLPNANTLNASYLPSELERNSGFSFLILTTTGNGLCTPQTDTAIVFFTPIPQINAGSDADVCNNNLIHNLNDATAFSTDILAYQWTTNGSGSFQPGTTVLNPTYIPSPNDTLLGNITLTLTVRTLNNDCSLVSDSKNIRFIPTPQVSAGSDKTVCKNNPTASLTGSSSTGSGIWSGGQGTFLPSRNVNNPTYTPSQEEIMSGSPVTLTFTNANTGACIPRSSSTKIYFIDSPVVNAGSDMEVCKNNPLINLVGTSSTGQGNWIGGQGNFVPNRNSLSTSYELSAAETSLSFIELVLESSNNGICNPVRDTVKITVTPSPQVNIGEPLEVCSDNPIKQLTVNLTVAQGVQWNANGSFNPTTTSLSPYYIPTINEIQNGSAKIVAITTENVLCNPVSDTARLVIHPKPIVYAGADILACGNVTSVQLNGSVQNAQGITWTSLGSGTFSNQNIQNPIYFPSLEDKNKGIVSLVATSTGNGLCQPVRDTVNILFSTVPVSNAGDDFTVCANDFPIQLNATGSPGSWVGGQGTFSPSRTVLNPIYVPTFDELNQGFVQLSYTTLPNGACASVSSSITITLKPAPIANAGDDQNVCGNFNSVNLNGTVLNAAGGRWNIIKGNGNLNPLPTALNAQYQLTNDDKSAGEVILVLNTTGNQECSATHDTIRITISPEVKLSAGPDQTLCANNASIQLNGFVQNANLLNWSGGNGNFIPNRNVANPVYEPTQEEINSGSLTLTLFSQANDPCPSFSEQVSFTFTPAPTVMAGSDIEICADKSKVSLSGSINHIPTGVRWKTSGSGLFSPSYTNLNVDYYPSEMDKNSGSLKIWLETTGSGTCLEVADTLYLTILPKPQINVGDDFKICADKNFVNLEAIFSNAGGVLWTTTNGTGSFSSPNSPQTNYQISLQDKSNGVVTLRATTTGNGLCNAVYDQVVMEIMPAPTLDVGEDRIICANTEQIMVQASFTVSKGVLWQTSGSGNFLNDSVSSTVYFLSEFDKNSSQFKIVATTTGNGICNAVKDSFIVNLQPLPIINIGGDRTICADSIGIPLTSEIFNAGGVVWSTDGSGNFYPNRVARNPNYAVSNQDRINGKVIIKATTTGTGICSPVSSEFELTILPAPSVDAGMDLVVCSTNDTVKIEGNSQNAASLRWFTTGSGKFVPSDSVAQTKYVLSSLDKSIGTVLFSLQTVNTGLCKPVFDQLTLTIQKAPTVNAGPDRTICQDEDNILLNGSVTNGNGLIWGTTGTGVFSNPNATPVTYTFSDLDLSNGSVQIILTNVGNQVCDPISDTLQINFTPKPSLQVSEDFEICRDVDLYSVNASFSVAGGVLWTSNGSGQFYPNSNSASVKYSPTLADKNKGSLELYVQTIDNGLCKPLRDTIKIKITPSPTIFVSGNSTTCVDQKGFYPFANITVAEGVMWETSGSGIFLPTNQTLTPFYKFSPEDSAAGVVTLKATTTGNGTCHPRSASLELTILPQPHVDAGPDITTCLGQDTIQLSGRIANAGGAHWITKGTGTFYPNDFDLNAYYLPSQNDFAEGKVELILITSDNGFCDTYSDTLLILFSSAPEIDAGNDRVVCKTDLPIQLNATGPNGVWIGGNGTFVPSRFALNAIYHPSMDEIANNGVKLYIETIRNGSCIPGKDSVHFQFIEGPVVNAGIDTTICANNHGIKLYATSNGVAGGVRWSTGSGTGTFLPSPNQLDAVFIPSSFQIQNGWANLTITTVDNGICKPATDNLRIRILPSPNIFVGPDITVCADIDFVEVDAKLTNATDLEWKTLGSGTFSDRFLPKSHYYLSPDDIANGFVYLVATTKNVGLCNEVSDTLRITILPKPFVQILNNDTIVCEDFNFLNLKSNVLNAGGLVWNTTGSGIFSPSKIDYNPKFYPSVADRSLAEFKIIATTTEVGICKVVNDTVTIRITPLPQVDAGEDREICETLLPIQVQGSSNTTIEWVSLGHGDFSNKNSLLTHYVPDPKDITIGGFSYKLSSRGNNECPNVDDYATVTFRKLPAVVVNAGFDQEICRDNLSTHLQGFILNAGGGVWSNIDGNGTFGNERMLETEYQFSPNDLINKDSIVVRLTSVDNGACEEVYDEMVIKFTPIPTIEVGHDRSVCSDTNSLKLEAQYTVAGGIKWFSNGNGYFIPNEYSSVAHYVFSNLDRNRSDIRISAETIDNGTCKSYTDDFTVNIRKAPIIDAGEDRMICKDAAKIVLNGTVSNATGGTWTTTGTGIFSPNNLTGVYIPSNEDKDNDIVILKVSSIGNGLCKPATDLLSIRFTPIPEVNAGVDQIFCGNGADVPLNGTVKIATGGEWKTLGSGIFSGGSNNLVSAYRPSLVDLENGSIALVLSSTGNGTCNPVYDTLKISFQAPPFAEAKIISACAYEEGIPLEGNYKNAGGVIWTSTGTGVFSATPAFTHIKYFPSNQDLVVKNLILTMQTTSNGVCPPAISSTSLTIRDLPVAHAGRDKFVCLGSDVVLSSDFDPNIKNYTWNVLETGERMEGLSVKYPSVNQKTKFELVVTDIYGCLDSDTTVVDVVNPVQFNMPQHLCLYPGKTILTNIVPPSDLATYQWFRNNKLIPNADLNYFRPMLSGTYTLAYNIDLCTYKDSTIVTDPPVLVPGSKLTCVDNMVTVETNYIPNLIYEWSYGNSFQNSTNFTATLDTQYVTVKGKDLWGCENNATFRIIGVEKPNLALQDDSACIGNAITLNATPLNINKLMIYNPYVFWLNQEHDTISKNYLLQVLNQGRYNFFIRIGECETNKEVFAKFNSLPALQHINFKKFCSDSTDFVILDAGPGTQNPNDTVLMKYLWSTGETSRKIRITQEGVYKFKITNKSNCSIEDSIKVVDRCPPLLFVPDAFTPTVEGPNQKAYIKGKHFKNLEVTVFNRWGEVIFYSNNKDESWDGKYKGEFVPVGIYPIILKYEGIHEEYKGPYNFRGKIMVIK